MCAEGAKQAPYPGFIPRRLEKFLRDSTPLSVKEGRRVFEAGRVQVRQAGAAWPTALGPDDLVYAEDEVLLDACPLRVRKRHAYLVLNKPKAVTCTLRDPCGKSLLCVRPYSRERAR